MTRKIAICVQYGGFGISQAGVTRYNELAKTTYINDSFFCFDETRNDPFLIQVIEEMKQLAAGAHCTLAIVEIPDDVEWEIGEYDGVEWVREIHRTWEGKKIK